ncbi:hypothetical protein CFC21_004929 [Triticum aestivum]|uniref:Uncharacterized protein n=2 Tax=Triticum aestivum TaxID=4565 RepID=A0A9R1INT1_WHEAT|nr:hypothetical protein CFC21_004929 [Triticum aestivum]
MSLTYIHPSVLELATKLSKSSWPELVGILASLAATQIAHDRPAAAIEVLPTGVPVTPDYNLERVRVFIDLNGIVAKTPVIG